LDLLSDIRGARPFINVALTDWLNFWLNVLGKLLLLQLSLVQVLSELRVQSLILDRWLGAHRLSLFGGVLILFCN
jgi:hypothetical protein